MVLTNILEILWMLGVVILLLMMATALWVMFLPWGQMSFLGGHCNNKSLFCFPNYWGLHSDFLWGGFSVDNPTLTRFFVLHYLLPFAIVGVVALHLVALHQFGSNNPTGLDVKSDGDTIPFHPYYTVKDYFGLGVYLIIFAALVFFAPNFLGHPDNYIPANPLQTPAHIVPEWYFLPFYAILESRTRQTIRGFTNVRRSCCAISVALA